MTRPKQKCVLYARFSPRPKEAMENCQSIGQQLAECRAYAVKKGYSIEGSYQDEGKSRNDFDRPGLLGAIRDMKRGWKLIAVRPDRVGSGQAFGVLTYQIEKRGATVEFATGDYNGDDPAKRLVRDILSHVAEYERAMTGVRTSMGMRYRQANDERMTHEDTLPIGKMVDPKDSRRMVDNPDEIPAVEMARKWRKAGESYSEIVRRLNASGYKPRGERWHRTTVVRMLKRSD